MTTQKTNMCEKYGLATTNYVMGEEMEISKEELFEHLRNCPKCREDLVGWQDMYAAWRTEGSLSQPEVQRRWAEFMAELKEQPLPEQTQPSSGTSTAKVVQTSPSRGGIPPGIVPLPSIELFPGEKLLNHEEDIGNAAGKVWHCLAQNGKIRLKHLKSKVKLPKETFHQALGWLARENKIHRTNLKKSILGYLTKKHNYVYLTEEERRIYHQQAQLQARQD